MIRHPFIVLHHTDSDVTTTPEQVDGWHRAPPNNFAGIGYHYLLHLDEASGQWVVSEGRPIGRVGAHDKGANTGIGVAVAGRYTQHAMTGECFRTLVNHLILLCRNHGLGADDIYGHSERAPGEQHDDSTDCPGYAVGPVRESVRVGLEAIEQAYALWGSMT